MPVQNYVINTPDQVVGQLYGQAQDHNVHTGLLDSTANIAHWGAALLMGATDNEVKVGGAAHVYGVLVRQQNKEAALRPSDGSIAFAEKDLVGVLKDGFILVQVEEAVTKGDAAHVPTRDARRGD